MSGEARPAVRRRTRRSNASRRPSAAISFGALLLSAAATALGAASAMPIYRTPRVWLVVGVGWALAAGIVWCGRRWSWGLMTPVALIAAFVAGVVPLAVPGALATGPAGWLRGLSDGLASVALGWKQLLTLALPVGSYQAVLVPLLVVTMTVAATIVALALAGRRAAPFAALPVLAPVLFGVVFGASQVSAPLNLGPLRIQAPRELALWAGACVIGAVWVAWSSGIERRAALRLGRLGQPVERAGGVRRNTAVRALSAALIALVALGTGTLIAPAVGAERTVPRDSVDPQLVVRQQTSPLASYRSAKRDEQFSRTLFTVSGDGALPKRLRIAVLDDYDGVDFFVDPGGDGRFTRFPSGDPIAKPTEVRIRIDGYRGIWLPVAPPLAEPPAFLGPRAAELSDSFYVNRGSWAAIAVPGGSGLRAGDEYSARMSASGDAKPAERPANAKPLLDLERTPQLKRWLDEQRLAADRDGLLEAIDRLRQRGYLSHSLTDGEGERDWIAALAPQYGTRFVPSAGGHSIARIEQLFQQLNEQQAAAGETSDERALVAGIGDDEQFAAAAALVARAMGYDSRVVLGVRLGGERDGVPGVPACAEACTGENLAAWIEVRGDRGGWAPVDTSPQVAMPPVTLDRGEQLPEFPTVPEDRNATVADPPTGSSSDSTDPVPDPQRSSFAALWPILKGVGLSALTLLLLALPLLFVPLAKRLRGRRRRQATAPEVRALGAWDELVDGYADSGAAPRARGSRRDIAEELEVPGGDWAAWTVDRAVYSREGIDDAEAEQVWTVVDEALLARRQRLGFWGRTRARFSLRSLLPESRRVPAGRPRRPRGGSRR